VLTFVGAAWLLFAPPLMGGRTTYVVTHGVSMEPTFHSGDLALVRPASQYRVGEVVAYHSSLLHIVVLHRIIAIHNGRYTFKGDNNNFVDPVHPTRAQLVGRLWIHLPGGGSVLGYLHSPVMMTVLVGTLGALLLWGVGETRGRRDRRKRRTPGRGRQGAGTMSPRLHDGASPITLRALLTAAGVCALVLLGLLIFAFSRPASKPATHGVPFTQKVRFGYHADTASGPVYPTGVVSTGDPIFLQLVHRLTVNAEYTLTSLDPSPPIVHGTEQVVLKLTGPTGWSRTIPLTAVRRFSGDRFRASVWLNLSALQALFNEVATQTGIPSSGDTIAVEAKVQVHGLIAGHTVSTAFTPALSFEDAGSQLEIGSGNGSSAGGSAASGASASGSSAGATGTGSGGSGAGSTSSTTGQGGLDPTQTGSVQTGARVSNPVSLAGLSLAVTTLRFLAAAGFLLALAASLALTVLVARTDSFGESARIQAQHGHMIVPINAGTDLGWPAIDVGSIKALVRLAEVSGQLILHSHADEVDTYLVNDEGSVYRYQVALPKVHWGEWTAPSHELTA